jgi:hypothetical protein
MGTTPCPHAPLNISGVLKMPRTTGDGLSNDALDGWLKKRLGRKAYLGAVPVDALPETLKDGQGLIVNLQPSSEGGSHWVCVSHQHGQCLYVDPFGGPPDDRVLTLMRRSKGTPLVSTSAYQPRDSDACGLFCGFVLAHHGRVPLYDLLYVMLRPDSDKRNDRVVRQWAKRQ